MHDQQSVERRDLRHRSIELAVVERWELIDSARQREALETVNALVLKGSQASEVRRDRAAPEADVHESLALGRHLLGRQGTDVDRRRDRVERHVDDCRDAPGGSRTGGRGKPLPGGPTRLVDVHVGVDETRHQHLVVGQLDDLVRFGDAGPLDRR